MLSPRQLKNQLVVRVVRVISFFLLLFSLFFLKKVKNYFTTVATQFSSVTSIVHLLNQHHNQQVIMLQEN